MSKHSVLFFWLDLCPRCCFQTFFPGLFARLFPKGRSVCQILFLGFCLLRNILFQGLVGLLDFSPEHLLAFLGQTSLSSFFFFQSIFLVSGLGYFPLNISPCFGPFFCHSEQMSYGPSRCGKQTISLLQSDHPGPASSHGSVPEACFQRLFGACPLVFWGMGSRLLKKQMRSRHVPQGNRDARIELVMFWHSTKLPLKAQAVVPAYNGFSGNPKKLRMASFLLISL